MTGYWQIHRTTAASNETMRDMELQYVRRHSFMQDIAILFLTPWRILFLKND
jgi:lipopolysaccharide/colanic/teichoic acid biosynthesis glycosyltransferase